MVEPSVAMLKNVVEMGGGLVDGAGEVPIGQALVAKFDDMVRGKKEEAWEF